jgi:hypothetical protein
MSDNKLWIGWAGGLFVAGLLAKHYGAGIMVLAVVGLVFWTINKESKSQAKR